MFCYIKLAQCCSSIRVLQSNSLIEAEQCSEVALTEIDIKDTVYTEEASPIFTEGLKDQTRDQCSGSEKIFLPGILMKKYS